MPILMAAFMLVVWDARGRTVVIPQATLEICNKNGIHMTTELGWGENWLGYQCFPTGYK